MPKPGSDHSPTTGLGDPLGGVGHVRSLPHRLRPGPAQRGASRRPIPCDPPRQISDSTKYADGSRTKPSGTGAAKDGPLYRIRRLLTSAAERISDRGQPASVASSTPVTPTEKSAQPGTPRKPYGASTRSTGPPSRSDTPSKSQTTSRTNPARRRSTNWVVPSPAGVLRSPIGTSRR